MYVSTSIWTQLACRNTGRHSLNSAKGTPKDENAKIMYVSIQSAYVRLLGAQFHLCFCPQRQRGTKQCIPSGRVFRVQRARCSTSSGHSCFVNQHQQVVRPPFVVAFYRHFHILKPSPIQLPCPAFEDRGTASCRRSPENVRRCCCFCPSNVLRWFFKHFAIFFGFILGDWCVVSSW